MVFRSSTVWLAIGLLTLVTADLSAQQGQGQGRRQGLGGRQFGGMGSLAGLLMVEEVRQELNVTDDQMASVREAMQAMRQGGGPGQGQGQRGNFSEMTEQPGDPEIIPFSFGTERIGLEQRSCYMTRTNSRTHSVIRGGLDRSPLFTGKIKSTGVRYCPSIEDKVSRFPDRDSHHVFIEPEGIDTDLYYPNGISKR